MKVERLALWNGEPDFPEIGHADSGRVDFCKAQQRSMN
jgi:hypothetical protein